MSTALKKIKISLIERGLSFKDLSEITGYTREHLSRVIHGKTNSPKTRKVISLVLFKNDKELWGEDESIR